MHVNTFALSILNKGSYTYKYMNTCFIYIFKSITSLGLKASYSFPIFKNLNKIYMKCV